MRVKTRRDRGGLEPKSKRGRRKREGDPITQTEDPITHDRGSHRDTAPQHRERVWTTTQAGTNKRVYTYEGKQITDRSITTRDGARNNHDAQNRKTGRRCCRTYTDGPRNSASLLETLQQKAMEQKTESKNRERSSEIGSAALRPLHARSLSSSSSSSFYSSKRGRSAFNSSPTKSNRFDPRMYLIRP